MNERNKCKQNLNEQNKCEQNLNEQNERKRITNEQKQQQQKGCEQKMKQQQSHLEDEVHEDFFNNEWYQPNEQNNCLFSTPSSLLTTTSKINGQEKQNENEVKPELCDNKNEHNFGLKRKGLCLIHFSLVTFNL